MRTATDPPDRAPLAWLMQGTVPRTATAIARPEVSVGLTRHSPPTFDVTRNVSGGLRIPATVPMEWMTVITGASGSASAH